MRKTSVVVTLALLFGSIAEASSALPPALRREVLHAVGLAWSDATGEVGSVRYAGTAFRVSLPKQVNDERRSYWVTAAHVAQGFVRRGPIFISPARLQPAGRFASPFRDADGGIYNSVRVRPRSFVFANTEKTLSECAQKISSPYRPVRGTGFENPGNDVCVVDGVSNFAERDGLILRDLDEKALSVGEPLYFAGYPLTGLGKLLTGACGFEGFTQIAGAFRGALFCATAGALDGFSGSPIVDREGRALGVLASSSAREDLRLDEEGRNQVVFFTPIRARGSSVDGFDSSEVGRENCVRVRFVGDRVELTPSGLCEKTPR